MVYAQKEILLDQQLPTNPPTGWAAVKDEILSFSHNTDSDWKAAGHGKTGRLSLYQTNGHTFPYHFCNKLL